MSEEPVRYLHIKLGLKQALQKAAENQGDTGDRAWARFSKKVLAKAANYKGAI